MAIHCLEPGCISTLPRGGMYWVVHSRQSRDIPRDARGTSPGPREFLRYEQPNRSRLKAVYGHYLIINPSLGMYQEIPPYRAISFCSVKINTFQEMRRGLYFIYVLWVEQNQKPSTLDVLKVIIILKRFHLALIWIDIFRYLFLSFPIFILILLVLREFKKYWAVRRRYWRWVG